MGEEQEGRTFSQVEAVWEAEHLPKLKRTSQTLYRRALANHIMPELRDTPVSLLTEQGIDAAVVRIAERAGERGSGLSQSSCAQLKNIIHSILCYAAPGRTSGRLSLGEGARSALELPDAGGFEASEKSGRGCAVEELSPRQVERICLAARQEHTVDMLGILLMLFTGIRSGELCALSWDDVDLDGRELYIHRTAHRVEAPEPNAEGNKTVLQLEEIAWKNQIRRERIPEELIPYMRELYLPGRSVMTGREDTPFDQRSLINRQNRIWESLELEGVNAQCIRRTWKNRDGKEEILRRVFAAQGNAEETEQGSGEGADLAPGSAEPESVRGAAGQQEVSPFHRGALRHLMAAEFSSLCATLGLSMEQVSDALGIDEDRLRAVRDGEQNFSWSEYLSLLFLFSRDEKGSAEIRERGLFPEALREMLTGKEKTQGW